MSSLVVEHTDDIFEPFPGGQTGFMDDYENRYCAFVGGWYAGKTWAGARKTVSIHTINAFDDDNQPTYIHSAVIAPTYQLAMDINVPEIKLALDEAGISWRFVADPKRFAFVLNDFGTKDMPSEIKIRTADAPDKITGWTVGTIWGDEAARWQYDINNPLMDPFVQADGRIRGKAKIKQFNLTFTHEGDATRMYEDFEENPKPHHVLYRSATADNPHAREFAITQAAQLTPELANQYLAGHALSLSGSRIYNAYDDARNKMKPGETMMDSGLPLDLSIDFNISPGMHGVIGQEFAFQDMFTAEHVLYEPRMDVRKMIASFLKWIKDNGGWHWPELRLFGDASGSSKWAGTGESAWDIVTQELKNANIKYRFCVAAANPGVGDRVNAFNCALWDLSGTVHYKVSAKCEILVRDFKNLKWDGNEVNKNDRRLSHASDADGYRVWYRRPVKRIQTAGFTPRNIVPKVR